MIGLRLFSAVLALWYQELRTQVVCEPTVLSDTANRDCDNLNVNSFVYGSVTPNRLLGTAPTIPLGIRAQLEVGMILFCINHLAPN